MQSNLEKYKKDLEKLVHRGKLLQLAMEYEFYPEQVEELFRESEDGRKILDGLPSFKQEYQSWYSEASSVVKQLLPDRHDDFIRHYQKPKSRKDITFENYRIEDYLQGLRVTRGVHEEKVVGPEAALPHLRQQLAIVESVRSRFESTLFDIRQLVQADLFDSEIQEARELLKKGFIRASGAVVGVVLEKHLEQVTHNHNIKTRKKNPVISDFNDLLKNGGVLGTPSWRQIQRLGDIRNLCDHNKDRDPTKEEAEELIDGVEKFTKSLF